MDNTPRKVEKRNRPPVSCDPCRTRKLKCNRALPCDSCVRRSRAASCHYAANANRSNPGSGQSKTRDFKDRLDTLETLVSSFISRESEIKDSPAKSYSSGSIASRGREDLMTPETPHRQESEDGHVNYIDPNHWQSILEDIREVRENLTSSESTPSHDQNHHVGTQLEPEPGAGILLSAEPRLSIDQVLSFLPKQPICDMLLSWYFGSRFMVLGIIHPVKFQNEYKSFWESPSTAPPLWTALLFSIISVTTTLRQMVNPAASNDETIPSPKILQEATLQCLMLGKYTTANAHALEAFLLHLQSCFLSRSRLAVDLWFEMGTIIRLAFRLGYHRDPRNLPAISIFDGEMRRRLWLNIVQIDALMSFQMGFPSMIPAQFCDTEDPRNLDYPDLQVGMTMLPPARPLVEHTPVLYTIVKSSVMGVFKKIVSHTQLPTIPSYETTLALEAEMRRAYSNIPEPYQRRDVNRSFTDPAGLILERFTIETLYLKGIIVLLRRFISYNLKNSTYESSRRACVEAALDVLARQADINEACESGGRLYEDRWMFASQPVHDFLLAAMVVCLDLSVRMGPDGTALVETTDHRDIIDRECKSLRTARQMWSTQVSSSREMRVGAQAIDLMIRKVAERDYSHPFIQQPPWFEDATAADNTGLPYASTMSQMIDGSETIDWILLDQYFQGLDGSNEELIL